MKKLMSLMLVFAMTNVYALAPQAQVNQKLSLALEGLQIELAQAADKEAKEAKVQQFTKTVRQLQAEGLSNEELEAFARTAMNTEADKQEFDQMLALIKAQNLNQADASKFIVESMLDTKTEGLSWSGRGGLGGVGVLLILLGLAALAADDDGLYCEDVAYCNVYGDCYYETECW